MPSNKKNPNKYPRNGKVPEKPKSGCGIDVKIPDQDNQEQRQESMINRKTPPQSVSPVVLRKIYANGLAYVPQIPRNSNSNSILKNINSGVCKTDTIYFSIDEEKSTISLYGRTQKMSYSVFTWVANLVASKVIEIVDRAQKHEISFVASSVSEVGICIKSIRFNSRKGPLIFSSDFIPKRDCRMIIVRQAVKQIVDDENKKRKFVN